MGLLLREFFFIRHGQTDHNAGKVSGEHIDISLNAFGQSQARLIEPTIAKLPIQTICYSPLKRAVETKEIISRNFAVPHREIADLSECSVHIWTQMTARKSHILCHPEKEIQPFIERVKRGLNFALKEQSPVLIVAHGGVYWAICHLLGINGEWVIDHCVPVHFSVHENKKWSAKKMIQDTNNA
ncbi:MAG: histidine phosphatase family protein [Verrucomicrobiota bacterium]